MKRLLVPSAALLWGLQFALLNPVLALLLVALFDATAGQVGLALAAYNLAGFAASLLVPAYADRRADYLRPMLVCAALTVALAPVLAFSTSLPVAVAALVVLGGPAGVGNSLLFAHLKHSGASTSSVINTRAVSSVAWVAGPPLATVLITGFGNGAVLTLLAVVAALTVVTAAAMIRTSRGAARAGAATAATATGRDEPMSRPGVVAVVGAFVLLQATNSAVVAVMSLYVTRDLGLPVAWAGIALGVAAGLEIPALLLAGRLTGRFSNLTLLTSGCVCGIAYYVVMTLVSGPVALLAAQVLNAWFFAVVAGVGLTLFQEVIPRAGLASGLYTNTRRVGAVLSGPLVGLGAATSLGYGAVFAASAALTLVSLVIVVVLQRSASRRAAGHPAREPGTVDTAAG
ncbi:MFS transporter [Kineococcus sp. TBRC 1896]|uniref:MFS transporter n=1 Tax=Kineococcus mangrovi TaxID=1660183 RepID=A0ABV4I3M7_9ACTN